MVEESIRYALFDSDRRRPADQPWVGALGTVAPPDADVPQSAKNRHGANALLEHSARSLLCACAPV